MKINDNIKIEVKDEWKRHYTETTKSGRIIAIDEDHTTILGNSGSPSRYINGTFDIVDEDDYQYINITAEWDNSYRQYEYSVEDISKNPKYTTIEQGMLFPSENCSVKIRRLK